MTAKEYLQNKYVSMRGARWNCTNIDDNWVAQMMEEYHLSEVEKLNIPVVVGRSEQLVCPECNSEDPDYSRGEYHCRCCGHDWAN